jgi:glycosyltransferase domain-containing protein
MKIDGPKNRHPSRGDLDANLTKLDSLTVVILTLNRQSQVRLGVEFWSQLPIKIVVVDGSDSPDKVLLDRPDVNYVHSRRPYLENHGVAAALVDSKYVISACDDELYVPSALVQCIEFLDDNPDFVAVCGEAIGLHSNGSQSWWEAQYVRMRGFELTEESGVDRTIRHLSAYRVLAFYAVARREEWVRAWKLVSTHEFSPFAASEIQFEAALVSAGKIRVLPILMWVRNRFVPPLWSSGTGVPGLDPSISFREWWTSGPSGAEREAFITTMRAVFREMLPRSESYSHSELDGLVRKGFSLFAGPPKTARGIHTRMRKFYRRISKKTMSRMSRIRSELLGFQSEPLPANPAQETEKQVVPVGTSDNQALAKLVGDGTYIDIFWLDLIGTKLLD